MYSIIYNPSNVPVRGYHPKGSLFRVDKRKFGVRVAISFPTELEAIAVIQHIETLATKDEVATFVKDLKEGGVRIITESGGGVEVVDEKVDVVEEEVEDSEPATYTFDSQETTMVESAVPYSQLKAEVESLRSQLEEKEVENIDLSAEILTLKTDISELMAEKSNDDTYKTKFEFLERTTGGVRKFTDLKNSFIKRLKFLFFPSKY